MAKLTRQEATAAKALQRAWDMLVKQSFTHPALSAIERAQTILNAETHND